MAKSRRATYKSKSEMDWAARSFFEARFDVVGDALNDENSARWGALSYMAKCGFISRQIEAGNMI